MVALCGLGGLSCQHGYHLDAASTQDLLSPWIGADIALKQSMYATQFYDENEWTLLTPYKPEDLYDLTDYKGRPLRPPPAHTIVPAGTRIQIHQIQWAEPATMWKRLLMTPRYSPWVEGRLINFSDMPAHAASNIVVVLPQHALDQASVKRTLSTLFGPHDAVSPWIHGLSQRHQVAIRHKSWAPEMTPEALAAAQGTPLVWLQETVQSSEQKATFDVAWYPSTEFWFQNGKLTKAIAARPMASAP